MTKKKNTLICRYMQQQIWQSPYDNLPERENSLYYILVKNIFF